jgi:hypothetical protein
MSPDDPDVRGGPEGARDPATGRIRKGHTLPGGGRPRKSHAPGAGPITRALDEKVTVTENNRRRRLAKRELNAKQVVNRGSSGDLRAAKLAFDLEARERAAAAGEQAAAPEELTETDQQILERVYARMRLVFLEEYDGPD